MSQNKLHLLVLYFMPLIVTTRTGDSEAGLLQNMVAVSMWSVLSRNTVATRDGMVAAVGESLQTPVGTASRILSI